MRLARSAEAWLAAPVVPALVSALLLACVLVAASAFTVDDAFIAATYARRLSDGLGYTFRAGPATDGVTGPLWLVPLVAGARLGGSAITIAKWLGAVASVGALMLVVARAARSLPGAQRCLDLRAPGLYLGSARHLVGRGARDGPCGVWRRQGSRSRPRRPSPYPVAWAFVAAFALCWLRPELLPFAAVLLLGLGLRERRGFAVALGGALLGLLSVGLFRLLMFGHLLPMVASAKPALLGNGCALCLERSAVAPPVRAWRRSSR